MYIFETAFKRDLHVLLSGPQAGSSAFSDRVIAAVKKLLLDARGAATDLESGPHFDAAIIDKINERLHFAEGAGIVTSEQITQLQCVFAGRWLLNGMRHFFAWHTLSRGCGCSQGRNRA